MRHWWALRRTKVKVLGGRAWEARSPTGHIETVIYVVVHLVPSPGYDPVSQVTHLPYLNLRVLM